MLAYVFWHWPRPGIASDDYEARQQAFHHALASRGPAALQASYVWRVIGAPWLPTSVSYEDWYVLENSAGLDVLNAAAISDSLREAHDAAASLAAGGVAALYTPSGPRIGLQPSLDGELAQWFAKPEGVRYSALLSQLTPHMAGIWTRMMVLGPAPEFVLLGSDTHALPIEWRAQITRRERIWPPSVYADDAQTDVARED